MTMPIFAPPVQSQPLLSSPATSNGARLVTADGRRLPLESSTLTCRAGGGLARSVVLQRFRNDGSEPLEVTYLLPLPSDGAVSGYQFTLRDVVTRGVVEPSQLARERYEQALLEGKSAALLEQDRSSVFRQAVGNVPPGEAIDLEVSVDHPLRWLDGAWELRFPTVVAPRYQSGDERSATVPVQLADETFAGPEHEAQLTICDELSGAPSSPSHALCVTAGETTRVELRAHLDRDVVVRWPVAAAEVGARLETARPGDDPAQYGLLTLLPPRGQGRALPRDLIVLLDTSGSMAGEPLAQAVRVVSALVQSLTSEDSLELLEFGSSVRRWRPEAVSVTDETRRAALHWLASLSAGGGTEMRSGIEAAIATLRPGALRQVILVSDGLIGFERQVLALLERRLPPDCRFHSLGVGHACNGSLLQPAARAGRGACVMVAPGEDVQPACAELLARTAQPLVVNLRVSGSALLEPLPRAPDLYGGAPALLPLALAAGGGNLEIRGDTPTGAFVRELRVEARDARSGDARLPALYARERIEDLELAFAAGAREPSAIEHEIESLGVRFQIASRLSSWVAVSEQVSVDGTRATRRVEQPQRLPAGMSAEGLGLRSTLTSVAGAVLPQSTIVSMTLAAPSAMAPSAAAPGAPRRGATSDARPPTPGAGRGGRGLGPARFGSAAPPATRGGASPTPPNVREASGIVRLNDDTRLVVAVAIGNDLDWKLPNHASLELADGTTLQLKLAEELCTRPAPLSSGQELRLVFRLSAPLAAAPRKLVVVSGAILLLVSLTG